MSNPGRRVVNNDEITRFKWLCRAHAQRFGGNREIAIKRDGEKCLRCGMTRKEHFQKFKVDITVDHIDKRGCRVPLHLKNNDLSNLQTLCLACHQTKDKAGINKEFCIRGHKLGGSNAIGKFRQCRACRLIAQNKPWKPKREKGTCVRPTANGKRWVAAISVKRKKLHVGTFDTKEEALLAIKNRKEV